MHYFKEKNNKIVVFIKKQAFQRRIAWPWIQKD